MHSFSPSIEIRPSDLGLGNYSGPLPLALLPAVGCPDMPCLSRLPGILQRSVSSKSRDLACSLRLDLRAGLRKRIARKL